MTAIASTRMRAVLDSGAARLALLGALCFAALASRRPDILVRPQFWAEDGNIFYRQAHDMGFLPTLLVPYSGYWHTLPRLIAGAALVVPLSQAPLVFNALALIVQSLPALYLFSSRLAHIAPLRVRLVLAFLYVGLPNVYRAHGSASNAQWYVAVLCFLILIAAPPRSVWAKLFDVTALAIGSLTGPFAALLVPVAAVLAWRRRDRWAITRGLIVAAGAIIAIAGTQVAGSRLHGLAGLGASFAGLCRILAFQIFMSVFWGSNPSEQLAQHPQLLAFLGYAIAGTGVAVLAYACMRGGVEVRCFLAFVALVLAASLISPLVSFTEPPWVTLQRPGAPHRYWVLPELAVAVAVVTVAATARRRIVRAVGVLAIGVMVLVDVLHWRMPPLPDLRFDDWAAAFAKAPVGTEMRIPILPPNWFLTVTKTERD